MVAGVEPDATVILYGSYARGEEREDSDIDLLILVDKNVDYEREKNIRYPLFDLAYETGFIISPVVHSKETWEKKYKITPFYENIQHDGILL